MPRAAPGSCKAAIAGVGGASLPCHGPPKVASHDTVAQGGLPRNLRRTFNFSPSTFRFTLEEDFRLVTIATIARIAICRDVRETVRRLRGEPALPAYWFQSEGNGTCSRGKERTDFVFAHPRRRSGAPDRRSGRKEALDAAASFGSATGEGESVFEGICPGGLCQQKQD